MRDDIYGGLKNAIERGISLENAIQSFVNAGYKEADVRTAAQGIQTGALSLVNPVSSPTSLMQQNPIAQQAIVRPAIKQKHRSNFLIIFLVALLFLSIAVFAVSLFYKEKIAEFIKSFLT